MTLQRAVEAAQTAGDLEAAGVAALTIIEELGEHLPAHDLGATFDRATELLATSGNREHRDRLLASSRRVLFLLGSLSAPSSWKGFNFSDAVMRYEARLIEGALKEAGGVTVKLRGGRSVRAGASAAVSPESLQVADRSAKVISGQVEEIY